MVIRLKSFKRHQKINDFVVFVDLCCLDLEKWYINLHSRCELDSAGLRPRFDSSAEKLEPDACTI